jgi:type II secretory pathway pseudopilin PulG
MKRGFSAVELMNLLGLLAVLSTIFMYGIFRYVRHAKTTEAVSTVTRIAEKAADYYNKSDETQPAGATPSAVHAMRHFPPPARGSIPPSTESVCGLRYQSNKADWAASPWKDLDFAIIEPQSYQYSFDSEGSGASARATITAEGDLDCDGHRSRFSITIVPNDALAAQPGPLEKTDPEE